MADELILVAGASGDLGRVIVRQLREEGGAVRALSRDLRKVAAAEQLGARPFVGDMLDRDAMALACEGVTQIWRVMSCARSMKWRRALRPWDTG